MVDSPIPKVRLCIMLLLVVGLFVSAVLFWPKTTVEERLQEAELAFARNDYETAESLARSVLVDEPDSNIALRIIGLSRAAVKDADEALKFLVRIQADGTDSIRALSFAGQIGVQIGRLHAAEICYRKVLEKQPQNAQANRMLAYILLFEGRSWEAQSPLFEPIRDSDFPIEHLIFLGSQQPVIENEQLAALVSQQETDTPLSWLGAVQISLSKDELAKADSLLKPILAKSPNQIEVQAKLGAVIARSRQADLSEWAAKLPVEMHPDIWRFRGTLARSQGQLKTAIRCFIEALKLDPDSNTSNYQLGQLLALHGDEKSSQWFLSRSDQLNRLDRIIRDSDHMIRDESNKESLPAMRKAAELNYELGRYWEAKAWSIVAIKRDSSLEWATEMMDRVGGELKKNSPRHQPDSSRANRIDLAGFPLPTFSSKSNTDNRNAKSTTSSTSISFSSDAASAGIDFQFFDDASRKRIRVLETTGGGVAVIDFDGDHWPDMHFTQGAKWPVNPQQQLHVDALYRNLGTGQFENVSRLARVADNSYSQGVTVGDFDNDGFPDLYVANIGVNRLYQNNGDGTFREVPLPTGPYHDLWTTSCVLCDLNGDSFVDIYDVNYIANDDLDEALCRKDGQLVVCDQTKSIAIISRPRLPLVGAEAAPDRLLLGTGDGGFRDFSQQSGVATKKAPGLGILAARFGRDDHINVFIAVDGFANDLFGVDPADPSKTRFVNRALARGLAYNRLGGAQACMGIAAGDVDRNGSLDLFVTNFRREYNTLYLQPGSGFFEDETARFGLRELSQPYVGWGTQFLDADCDGDLDVIVTNGDVFNNSEAGVEYRMPTQFFANLGGAKMREISAAKLGRFFEHKYVGRSLARLDWNRDGRDDVVISHIGDPVTLLSNQTENCGHAIRIRLVGISSGRDAIGTVVTMRAGGRESMMQLTAGDGYQASNERKISFGLGAIDTIEWLRISWPSGQSQSFDQIPIDSEMQIIEGDQSLHILAR